MPWVWLWHISKCRPHFSKLGVQYCPPACGRRAILHSQFLKIRSAFTDAPSPDSRHSSNTDRFLHHYSKHQSSYQLILRVHFNIGNQFWYITIVNTLFILRGIVLSPSSIGFASGHRGGYCPTPQDLEGIFQYLLAMPAPLFQSIIISTFMFVCPCHVQHMESVTLHPFFTFIVQDTSSNHCYN